jgi:hypothetical protein
MNPRIPPISTTTSSQRKMPMKLTMIHRISSPSIRTSSIPSRIDANPPSLGRSTLRKTAFNNTITNSR